MNHNGTRIESKDGQDIMPPAPKVWVQTAETCPACQGKKYVAQPGEKRSFTIGGAYTKDTYNNRSWVQAPQTYTTTGITTYWPCTKCGRKGTVAGQKLQEVK